MGTLELKVLTLMYVEFNFVEVDEFRRLHARHLGVTGFHLSWVSPSGAKSRGI